MGNAISLRCIVCGQETELVITPDIDCAVIPVCEKHIKEVRTRLILEEVGSMGLEDYLKKIKKKIN